MRIKADIISATLALEGGYSDHPADRGGPTNYGITLAVARDHGYIGAMIDLPRHLALEIYAQEYWEPIQGDRVAVLSAGVVREVYDTAVNAGVHRAVVFLQRALTALSGVTVAADGILGSQTLAALQAYLRARDEQTLVSALDCLQGAFYIELTERDPAQRAFVYGWLKNRVGNVYG